jgi:hypothetical protein
MADHLERQRSEPDETNVATVPLYCQGCGIAVTLIYRPDGVRTGAWSCPRCNRIQKIDLPGVIVRVVAR